MSLLICLNLTVDLPTQRNTVADADVVKVKWEEEKGKTALLQFGHHLIDSTAIDLSDLSHGFIGFNADS